MRLFRHPISLVCVLLLSVFFALNVRGPKDHRTGISPKLEFVRNSSQDLGGFLPNGLWQVDEQVLRTSSNKLGGVAVLRELGNSLRVAFGQRIDWIVWGKGEPLMLFPEVDLWVSRGLDDIARMRVTGATARIAGYRDQLAKEGWTLVIVPVPTKVSMYRERVSWPIKDTNLVSRNYIDRDRADDVYNFLLQRLASSGVTYVDLRTLFRAEIAAHPSVFLYAPNDTHWSGAGIRLAARATAQTIAATTPIRMHTIVNPTFYVEKHVGDLVKAYDVLPSARSWLRSAWEFDDELQDGEAGKGFTYATHPSGLVVVVGTSYTGQYTWITNEPVGFSWQVGLNLENVEFQNRPMAGHGSFVAFAEFWKARANIVDEFKAAHGAELPRVLVWEIPVRDVASIGDIH